MTFPGPKVVDEHDPVVEAPVHAALGPSSASRWLDCTASVALVEKVRERHGEDPAGIHAARGSFLHEIAEKAIISDVPLLEYEGDEGEVDGYSFIYSDDDHDDIEDYVLFCQGLKSEAEYWSAEQKVTVIPGRVWGTADFVAVVDRVLYVVDLKTGYNWVEALGNPQLMLYALGAHQALQLMYEYDEVEMVIAQPRRENMDRVRVSVQDLEAFSRTVDRAIMEIDSNPHFRPSEAACKWCPARATCPEMMGIAHQAAQQDFREMDDHALREAWDMIPVLEAYISGVKSTLRGRMEAGEDVPGFKMVEGRKTRTWADEERAANYLSRRIPKFQKNAFTHKLLSPTQMEKLVKKLDGDLHKPVYLDRLIEMKIGNPVLTVEDDKRPGIEYGSRAAADFADVE